MNAADVASALTWFHYGTMPAWFGLIISWSILRVSLKGSEHRFRMLSFAKLFLWPSLAFIFSGILADGISGGPLHYMDILAPVVQTAIWVIIYRELRADNGDHWFTGAKDRLYSWAAGRRLVPAGIS